MRYKLQLSYNGKDFHGWQRQPNASSIQQTIEDAFKLIFQDEIQLFGCGRTDAGVHAKFFIAHFNSENIYNQDTLIKLNNYFPSSIALQIIEIVSPDFHARFDAVSREYKYYILTQKDPFLDGFSWYFPNDLNLDLMKEAALQLFNYTDFTSFSKLHTDVKTNNCKIKDVSIIENNGLVIFHISADRFLRNMVRAIVGTLMLVGREKISVQDFCEIIENKNRSLAGQSAPAEGLYLTDVRY